MATIQNQNGRTKASSKGRVERCQRIGLTFGDEVGEVERRRIQYAFQVFCAVHEYENVDVDKSQLNICYGNSVAEKPYLRISAAYVARNLNETAPPPSHVSCLGVRFPVFHAPGDTGVDWLGEIFEWISSAHELAIVERDSAGRIPFAETLHGRYELSPTIPYASVAMEFLDRAIQNRFARAQGIGLTHQSLEASRLDNSCTIVATHDVDFLPVTKFEVLKRLAKNLLISVLAYRDFALSNTIFLSMLRYMGGGRNPLDCLNELIEKETRLGIKSSYYFLVRQDHRRDGNYSIEDTRALAYLRDIACKGMEVGVHGSYESLNKKCGLEEEYRRLAKCGFSAEGGRQHWLRYVDSTLFNELRRAGVSYDCSVGYSERVGFRTGAAFSYPPYSFEEETHYPFLEIPLVVMDSAIYVEKLNKQGWKQNLKRVMDSVRTFGRTGVSILWHDTVFRGGQLPLEVANLYWDLKKDEQTWDSASSFVRKKWPQYERAGLFADKVMANAA